MLGYSYDRDGSAERRTMDVILASESIAGNWVCTCSHEAPSALMVNLDNIIPGCDEFLIVSTSRFLEYPVLR